MENKDLKTPNIEKMPTLKKKHLKKANPLTVASSIFLVLTHLILLFIVAITYRYYGIYPSLFGSVIGVALCFIIVLDILFFVGINHEIKGLKIFILVMTILITLSGTVGSYALLEVNGVVDSIFQSGTTAYEKVSGVFVHNKEDWDVSDLKGLTGKKVGYVTETERGISEIARDLVKEAGSDPIYAEYPTQKDLFFALVDGDIDVAIMANGYRSLYSKDENNDYSAYIEKMVDFYTFDENVEVTTNQSKKDLTKEPFNVLLIGWSRTEVGSSIGLADAIIVVTVNPQTLTASMMSIARDSFVPVSCYGGEYDKINSGRATSRACFIETVEDFLDMEMDFYVEADYEGIVYLVDAIGGVEINNPVEFEMDGYVVPAGQYVANGWQALEFCRERHAFVEGDFARQQHQKEVIMEIVKKIVQSGDINLAMSAMKVVSNGYISTDMTLTQLTSIFNMIVNIDNYTGMDLFDLLDFHALRITGDGGIKYYSYSMRLPLWVYLIYQGSYDESIEHINEVMGNPSTINQDYVYSFSANSPYERQPFYSLTYPNTFMYSPDPMPDYWPNLTGYTLSEAMSWANEHGVKLSLELIGMGDSRYKADYEGKVYDQSVRYGQLIKTVGSYVGYSEGTITVMGSADESKYVPDFVGDNYSNFVKWADKYDVDYKLVFDKDASGETGRIVSQSVKPYALVESCGTIEVRVKAGVFNIKFDGNGSTSDVSIPSNITVTTGDSSKAFQELSSFTKDGIKYVFAGWYTAQTGGKKVEETSEVSGSNGSTVTLYAHWAQLYVVTLDANGGSCSQTSTTTDKTLPNASKAHSTFDGWYTTQTGGNKVTDLSTLTAATTLYAHYTEVAKYSYKFISDGTEVSSGELYIDEKPSVPSVTKEGYTLSEWTETGSKESGAVTYTAVWAEEPVSPSEDGGEEPVGVEPGGEEPSGEGE